MKQTNPKAAKRPAQGWHTVKGQPYQHWLAVNVKPDATEMVISGPIGSSWYDDTGTTSNEFREALNKIPKGTPINIHVNSEGGSVKDGLEIYNCIRARAADITCYNAGYCMSIASVFPLAAGRVVSNRASVWMIHSPLTMTIGNAEEDEKSIEMLEANADVLASIYAEKTGKSKEDILADMNAETWMSGEESVAYGLADELGDD